MKTKILQLILASILMIFIAPQCTIETDPCEGVNCLNGGDCDDGNCYCPDWYEGSNCGTQSRAAYYGIYTGVQTYESFIVYNEFPNVQFQVGASPVGVNFIGIGSRIDANLTFPTQGDFTIPAQQFGIMWIESGYGNITGNRLQMIYYGLIDGISNTVTYDGYR